MRMLEKFVAFMVSRLGSLGMPVGKCDFQTVVPLAMYETRL
jgi:hypothetical protein